MSALKFVAIKFYRSPDSHELQSLGDKARSVTGPPVQPHCRSRYVAIMAYVTHVCVPRDGIAPSLKSRALARSNRVGIIFIRVIRGGGRFSLPFLGDFPKILLIFFVLNNLSVRMDIL